MYEGLSCELKTEFGKTAMESIKKRPAGQAHINENYATKEEEKDNFDQALLDAKPEAKELAISAKDWQIPFLYYIILFIYTV